MSTADNNNKRRDALTGINRRRLRGTLTAKMTMRTNQDMFERIGSPWTNTRYDESRKAEERATLHKHLHEAYNGKLSEKDLSHVGQKPKPPKPWDFLSKDKPVHIPFDKPLTIKQARQLDAFVSNRLNETREETALARQPRPKVDRKELSRQQRAIDNAKPSRTAEQTQLLLKRKRVTAIVKKLQLLAETEEKSEEVNERARDFKHFKVITPIRKENE